MLKRRIYYALKPYLPWRIRMALRRISAHRLREETTALWPILPGSEAPPSGWKGWHAGKKFALVLTHDVEGPEGLEKCRKLAEIEMELGFRSSFNFVPEGSYRVPHELRTWLIDNGFEVGVHDLHHDGKLYTSRKQFTESAHRINGYLKEWGAVGYRSGFMLRNLDWHHDLEVEYDATTFDTDPFEPQPDGAGTIFPFWVPSSETSQTGLAGLNPQRYGQGSLKKGYVELPYTLPQDSTLFLLFREKTSAIWLRKLDWIQEQGGMVLVNVHPDYLGFDDELSSAQTYPVRFYAELLQAAKNKYAGQFWNPLPRELALWFKSSHAIEQSPAISSSKEQEKHYPPKNISGLKGKRAAVLLYSIYPNDPRPYRAAQAMIEAGMSVDMFCLLDKDIDEPLQETLEGVKVVRVPFTHKRSGGALMYFIQYGRFIFSAFWFLARRSLREKYDLVHVHNMPDILVFSTLVPKLQGAKIILDLHDPMPELMMTIYNVKPGSASVGLLKRLEKWSMAFAHSVVTVNEACRKIFAARSCPAEKVHVVMNAPDESIFTAKNHDHSTPPVRVIGKPFVIMYHGSFVERHGLDLAVAALAKIKISIPDAELRVYGGRNSYLDQVLQSDAAKSLGKSLQYMGSKTQREIVDAIALCDVGIIPNRRSIFTELNTPTRLFEYLSQAKPVIAPRAPGIEDYFGPEDLVYFELGNVDDLAEKIAYVYHEPVAVSEIIRRGRIVYRKHDWSRERNRLMDLFTQTASVGELHKEETVEGILFRGDK